MTIMCNNQHSPSHGTAGVCCNLLKRPWKATESGQQRNEALEYLLRYHLDWNGDTLHLIETIAGDAMVELLGEEPLEESSTYPTLTK